MPAYDYRCNACGRASQFFYKTYKDYDAASTDGSRVCPNCGSKELVRTISRVAIPKPGRNYAKMSSDEMLSVLEGGDAREVGRLMHEVGQDAVLDDPAMADAAKRLMKGESVEKVEADLSASGGDAGT